MKLKRLLDKLISRVTIRQNGLLTYLKHNFHQAKSLKKKLL